MPEILRYGARWPSGATDLQIELACVRKLGKWEFGKSQRKAGNGLPFHVKEAMKILWPHLEWHRWADMILEGFLCSTGRFAVFGPASSGKSCIISRAALVMYYARPIGTTVLISSTDVKALQRRIWSEITEGHREAKRRFKWLPGKIVESKTMLLNEGAKSIEDGEGSAKDGVIGVACRDGNVWRGLSSYIGLKNDVVILVCDELPMVHIAIVDSVANLESNEVCFVAGMGNLADIHNPLAKLAEPKMGWDSLPKTDKSRLWDTRWKNGRCLQLIGKDSPNFDFPEGQEPFKKLIGRRYIEQCRQNYGEGTDKFNMFASGELPSGNMDRTVFKKSDWVKYNASSDVRWSHEKVTRGYMLDAAYSGLGGDRTAGAPFIFGKDITGNWRFWCGTTKIYPGSSSPKISHAEAIAMEVKRECEAHGIPPEHVFFDGTGRSELTSAFARHWDSKVVPLEFGGPATERISFTGEKFMYEDHKNQAGQPKTCRDVFDRFVTELWFAVAWCIRSDQMRGMSEEIVEEGCQRKWEFVRGSKYCIETKEEMKERGLRSPDLTDMLVCGLEGARRLGFPLGKTSEPKKPTYRWLDAMRDQQWENIKRDELQEVE